MSEALISMPGLQPQPDFPSVDITAANAERLELILANLSLVEQGRHAVETQTYGDRCITSNLRNLDWPFLKEDREGRHRDAFNYGISAYEALGNYVRLAPSYMNGSAFGYMLGLKALDSEELADYWEHGWRQLIQQTPRTAETIDYASERFFAGLGAYVLSGAGIARRFELTVTAL